MSEPNRTPFQDITNTSTRTDANARNGENLGKKPPSRNGWYARMTPEKRAEYLEKQRERRKQKKAAEVSEEERAEYLQKQRIYRQKKKMAAVSGSSENVEMPGQSSQRVSPGVMQMGSGQSCITQQRRCPNALGSQKHKENDDISWLHRNDTYQRTRGKENYTPNVIATASSMRNHISRLDATETQTSSWSQISAEQSFVEPDERTAAEKKRQRSRVHYANMPAEKRGIVLQRNRDNKKGKFIAETSSPSQIMNMPSATIIGPSPTTPAVHTRSDNNSSDAIPGWNDDVFLWRRIRTPRMTKNHDSNMSGFLVLKCMRSWNGKEVAGPFVRDAYEIQNKVLVHMLTYKDNECQANIPQDVQALVKRIGIDYFL